MIRQVYWTSVFNVYQNTLGYCIKIWVTCTQVFTEFICKALLLCHLKGFSSIGKHKFYPLSSCSYFWTQFSPNKVGSKICTPQNQLACDKISSDDVWESFAAYILVITKQTEYWFRINYCIGNALFIKYKCQPVRFGTYRICDMRRLRRACTSVQARQSIRFSHTQNTIMDESSCKKLDIYL